MFLAITTLISIAIMTIAIEIIVLKILYGTFTFRFLVIIP